MPSKHLRFNENGNKNSHYAKYLNINNYSKNIETTNKIPPGYVAGDFSSDTSSSKSSTTSTVDRLKLLEKQAWTVAMSPSRQILMTGIMMYMTGSGLSIFTLMMFAMALWTPIKGLMSVNDAFKRYQSKESRLILQKLTFLGFHLASVGIGIWKIDSLGLLPFGNKVPPTMPAPNYTEFSATIMM